MSLVQTFLRENPPVHLDRLVQHFAVHARTHARFPQLLQLTYDQVATPVKDPQWGPLLQECRGLILDTAANYQVVARPFDKFFNLGEDRAAAIDWATATVQEKLDGSLAIAYSYAGAWQWATKGRPDAGGPLQAGGYATFADLLHAVWTERGYQWPKNPYYTLLFELTSPHNRIVVPHRAAQLTLLAVRNVETGAYVGEQMRARWAQQIGCPAVRTFPLQTLAAVLDTFARLNPLDQEGYVVVDGAGQRIKVKHPGYVALHHLKDQATEKNFIDVVRRGETAELLVHFPDLAAAFRAVQARYDRLCAAVAAAFADPALQQPAQKDFAAAVQATYPQWAPVLFALRTGKIHTPQQYLATCTAVAAQRLLGRAALEPSSEKLGKD